MQLNLNKLTKDLIEKQSNKIPEQFRSEYLETIQKIQTELEYKLYPGEFGSIKIVIDHKGAIHSLDVEELLIQNSDNIEQLSGLISESVIQAYQRASKGVHRDLDMKIKQLHIDLQKLKEKIDSNRGQNDT